MRKNDVVVRIVLCLFLMVGGFAFAQQGMGKAPPKQDISGKRHPNLAAAQHHLDMAFEKIQAAQQANEFDLDGHAAKARDLIDQADKELKQAARTANKESKEK